MAVDGFPTYQYISGTTAAVVSSVPSLLHAVIVEDLDSGTVTIGDGATTILVAPAVGAYDFKEVILGSGVKVTTSKNGQALVIYSTI